MKKYIFGAVFSIGLLVSPALTQASGLTSSQVQAILSLLSSFGADQSVINNVQASLTGSAPTTGGQSFCHNFNTNLKFGDQNDGVTNLDRALIKEGFLNKDEVFQDARQILNFDETTASAVVQFQAKYGISQTGYVGPMTRAKLNSLYGCANQSTRTTAPTITKITPNQTANNGTITITVYGANLTGATQVKFYNASNLIVAGITSTNVATDGSPSKDFSVSTDGSSLRFVLTSTGGGYFVGNLQVRIITPAGTSNALPFTVTN